MKKDFIEYIKKEFGFDEDEVRKFEASLNTPLKKSIRVNTKKISLKDFSLRAKKNNWTLKSTNLGKNIFYIDRQDSKQIALGNTPEHIAGYFYVQEVAASSSPFYMSGDMIDENEYLILDMSASPGGKATQISEYYPNSLIVANELDKTRLKSLFSNLDRMSALNTVVSNYDGRFFKQILEIFDKILLDAPCSGEGTAFKTDDALKYWNLKNIKNVAKLQFGLLESAIKSCKPGGEIVYSTCTLNKIENEGVINKALKKYGEYIEIMPPSNSPFKGGEQENLFMRNWPHLNFTGGFFVAKIKKTKSIKISSLNDEQSNKWNTKKELKYVRQNIEKISSSELKKIKDFFMQNFGFDVSNYNIYNYKGEIHLTNKGLNEIWDKLFLYKIGVNIGNIKSGAFIPNFYAGTFTRFSKGTIEVSKDDLDRLLSGYELELKQKKYKDGYYQIIYDELELGLAKLKNSKLKSLIPSKLMRN